MTWHIYALVLTGSVCAAFGQLLFKLGATGRTSFASFVNGRILLGLILYSIGTGLWIVALSRAKLTSVYPFTALTFVLVYLLGVAVLGEVVPLRAAVGVTLVLLGLFLIANA
jgi:undecaprenyl phosphate-alpha-L-ara4N flippase subunit ArnE